VLGTPIQTEAWDLDNDGVYNDATGSQVQHSFEKPGTYTVGLEVTDELGGTSTTSANIVVQNRDPAANFSVSPSAPSTLQSVTFTSTSTDPDGTIASYAWDLDNDGNFKRRHRLAGVALVPVRGHLHGAPAGDRRPGRHEHRQQDGRRRQPGAHRRIRLLAVHAVDR
jgi:hypothetical protein